MEIYLIIVGLAYIVYSLFSYFGDGVVSLGNLDYMHHKWLFSLWVGLWSVPLLIIGLILETYLLVLSSGLFFSLTVVPFLSKNKEMALHVGTVGGILLALLSLGIDFTYWMGFILMLVVYLVTLFRQIENANFYNVHFAFLFIYVSLWMV